MKKVRTLISALAVGGFLATTAVAATAPAAHANVAGCPTAASLEGNVIYADRNGATFLTSVSFVNATSTKCNYQGVAYFSGNGSGPYIVAPNPYPYSVNRSS